MKLYKPQQLSLLTRTFENDGKVFLVLTMMMGFEPKRPNRLLHEASFWERATKLLGETVLDQAMSKQHGELLVGGCACAPGGKPTPGMSVKVALSRGETSLVEKELLVVGDRTWSASGMSMPEPFTRMPITWARAFGGAKFEQNPSGRGHEPVEEDGVRRHRLPNIEDPRHKIVSERDRPKPIGIEPIGLDWPIRTKKAGTYDDQWMKTRFPGFAADFDWTYFNVAPDDQQIDGWLLPGDAFEIGGMTEDGSTFRGVVPDYRARALVFTKGSAEPREPTTRVDTLFLVPTAGIAIVIQRGVLEIEEDDASDVTAVLAAFESPREARDLAYYLEVKAERDDPKYGALRSIDDARLLPKDVEAQSPDEAGDTAELVATENRMLDRQKERIRREREAMKAELLASGLDPKKVEEACADPPEQKVPTASKDIVAMLEGAEREGEARRAEALAEVEKAHEKAKADLASVGLPALAGANGNQIQGGPPTFRAEEAIEQLRNIAQLRKNAGHEVPELEELAPGGRIEQGLLDVEARLLEAYRLYGHLFPDPVVDTDAAKQRRAKVIEALATKASMAGWDLTGADLAGFDFTEADLRGAMLEKARLVEANFARADLEGAVLVRADLQGANLDGAKLAGANLGKARLVEARFGRSAALQGVVLFGACLDDASLPGANLEKAQLMETTLRRADLSGTKLESALFLDADASEASFERAELKDAMFVRTKLEGAKLAAAKLKDASFVEVRGAGASFVGADLTGARIVLRTVLDRGDFKGAQFFRSCLRTTSLIEADFSGATMPEVDLSECALEKARFYRTDLRGSFLVRADLRSAVLTSANLMMSILQKASIEGADLRGANLFRADMAKAHGDKNTRFDDSYRVQVRVVPERRRSP